jgi:hypothetical protein
MKTDSLQDEFYAFLTPYFAQYYLTAIEPRSQRGTNENTQILRCAVYSTNDRLPTYDPALLNELTASVHETAKGALIKGRFKSAEVEIGLFPKRVRQVQPA